MLVSNGALRALAQRKLNRCWSPEEIAGWLRKTYPHDSVMRVCHETIYQALLIRDDTGAFQTATNAVPLSSLVKDEGRAWRTCVMSRPGYLIGACTRWA